jgi:predicted RNA-binding protein YlqC (UPF0109 family)
VQALVEYLARALVDQPDAVELKVTPQEGVTLFELKVAPDDIGKLIGRDGRTINALRTVVSAAAQKKGEKARVELIDDKRNNGAAVAASPAVP